MKINFDFRSYRKDQQGNEYWRAMHNNPTHTQRVWRHRRSAR